MEEIQDNPPRSRGGNRAAFTLAEVLITIGIIGIVAALTIPTLIKNYQKKAWVNELKVAYATINQMFKQSMAEDQVSELYATDMYNACAGVYGLGRSTSEQIENCAKEIRKHMKVNEVVTINSTQCSAGWGTHFWKCGPDGKCSSGMGCDGWARALSFKVLNSTTMIFAFNKIDVNSFNVATIVVDVNGPKGPNILGRDAFYFYTAPDGHLIPYGSKEHLTKFATSQGLNPDEYIRTQHWSYVDTCTKGKTSVTSGGRDCTARVVEEGWVMNY